MIISDKIKHWVELMKKKEDLSEINSGQDLNCPEGTKRYLLNNGYKPYRKESGRIVWRNASNRIYKSIKQPRRRSIIFKRSGGQFTIRLWVKFLIGLLFFLALIGYLLLSPVF